jgi:hypothetical protein
MKSNRPFLLWLICFLFLTAGFTELLKVLSTLTSWNILVAVQYQPSPIYPLFCGAFFFLAFLACAVLLWLRLDWAIAFATITALLFTAWYWVDRLLVSLNPQPFSSQVFTLIVFVFVLGLLLASLWVLHPSMEPVSVPPGKDPAIGGSHE